MLKTIKVTSDLVIEIPKSFTKNNVEYVCINEVIRPTCKYGLPTKDGSFSIITFDKLMELAITEKLSRLGIAKYNISIMDIISQNQGDRNFIPTIVRLVQRFINSTVNKLPIHKTTMNSWAINRRIHFLDPAFENIVDPNDKLKYQLKKADTYFDRGWTLMGLSDSNLSDCNYIFTDDLRKYTPFGIKHHNPQRNLYQTLGMKGDELPAIRTVSQQKLISKGILRRGWIVSTLFLDVPLNFEDQILINRASWSIRHVTL